uniref:hypothetical protein n=1 Tax=Virgifigura deserti TaxID=2268457 RepID=UPI003CCBF075
PMYKLLSSTALALVFAVPAWAEQMNTRDTGPENTAADRGRLVIAQDTLGADDDAEDQEEEIPDVMETQPGVITGEDVDDDNAGALAPGSTGGPGDTAEGGGTDGGTGGGSSTGSGSAGGETGSGGGATGSSGSGSGGSSGGSGD